MKLHRFFIEQPLGEEIEIKEKSLLHQWNNVLRFKKGESLILFNSSNNIDYTYCLSLIEKGKALLELVSKKENLSQEETGKSLTLCFSLIKRDNLDLVLEKCTEIGVLKFKNRRLFGSVFRTLQRGTKPDLRLVTKNVTS
jgi:16S rRNA (uracil1498-N3)-methyltransferase